MRSVLTLCLTRSLFLLVTLLGFSQSARSAAGQTCVPPPSGVLAWWPLDETSGTIAQDIVGSHPAVHFGAPTPAVGQVGGALHFGGADFLGAADSELWAFGKRSFSIELWANFDTSGGGTLHHPSHIFIGNDEAAGDRNKWFFALGQGFLNFHINGPALGPKFFPLAPFSPQVGRWYHLAVTRNGDLYTIFVDGTPTGSIINEYSIPNPNASLMIGQAEGLGLMRGYLDEITVYDRALTEAEVKAVADAGSAGKCKSAIVGAVVPSTGGDTSSVTVRITGSGFTVGTTVKLFRDGELDIVGNQVQVIDNSTLNTTFDLTGKTLGAWGVALMNPDGNPVSLAEAFTIEKGRAPELWADIVGLSFIRLGQEQKYWILYGNRGNVNLQGADLFLSISQGLEYRLGLQPDFKATGQAGDIGQFLPILIPPGSVFAIPVTLRATTATDNLSISVASSEDDERFGDLVERFSVPTNYHKTGFLANRQEAGKSMDSLDIAESSYVDLIKKPYVDAADGYIDFFIISDPDVDGGRRFKQTGVRLDGEVNWNYPSGLNTMRIPFDDFKDGRVTLRDQNGNEIRSIRVEHKEAIRPAPATEMEMLVQKIKHNREYIEDIVTFCNGTGYSTGDCAAFPSTSCVGYAVHLVYADVVVDEFSLNVTMGQPIKPGGDRIYPNIEDARRHWLRNATLQEADPTGIIPWLWVALGDPEVSEDWLRWWAFWKFVRSLTGVSSIDPNAKTGAKGLGVEGYIAADEEARYAVFFENISSATAPAQEVLITDLLDGSKLDLNNLSLGPITFADQLVIPPPGSRAFAATIDLRPAKNLIVRIEANLDAGSGLLIWRFTSIDPATGGIPEDPFAGFLPPNVHPPEGEGSVLFTVKPKEGLATGTDIRNRATIIFDLNAPIETQEWLNTLDNTKPSSQVIPLASLQTALDFEVQWSGTDVGSGVKSYDLWVSEQGGPFKLWLTGTTETMAVFHGMSGRAYEFYSVARDSTDNMEDAPPAPDSATQVAILPPVIRSISPNTGPTEGGTPVTISGSGFAAGATVLIGGVAVTDVEIEDPTTISVKTVFHEAGAVDVSVTNPDGLGATLPQSYFFYSAPTEGFDFFTLAPCRVIDTRWVAGPLGGPALGPSEQRLLTLTDACGIPSSAKAIVANLTAVSPTGSGYLSVFPGNAFDLGTSVINFSTGQTRATNGIMLLATDGSGSLGIINFSGGSVHLVLDVSGYFE